MKNSQAFYILKLTSEDFLNQRLHDKKLQVKKIGIFNKTPFSNFLINLLPCRQSYLSEAMWKMFLVTPAVYQPTFIVEANYKLYFSFRGNCSFYWTLNRELLINNALICVKTKSC